jgi:hypothetical protein
MIACIKLRLGSRGLLFRAASEHVDRARFGLPSDTQQERGLPVGERSITRRMQKNSFGS